MSSPIVTLPANVSSGLPYFPADQFAGLQLDVKRNIAFDNTLSRAASGRETGVSWRELPVTTFELDWAFLDANTATTPPSQDGSPVYPEFDKLLGFFSQQHGDLMPFYLKLSNLTLNPADSQVYGQQLAIGDGSTVNFQLCRTVGPYLEIVQTPDPASHPTIYVDGITLYDAAGPNPLQNADFALGDSGWIKGTGWTVVSGTIAGRTGGAAAFTGPGSAAVTNVVGVPCVAGQTVSASCDVVGETGANGAATVRINFFDASSTLLATVNSVAAIAGSWTRISANGTAPAGSVSFTVDCAVNLSTNTHPWYATNFTVGSYSMLGGGIVQFAFAPPNGSIISADFNWVYLVRFDAPATDIDQFAYLVHECKTLKLRTVIQ
jgi:hypothetical protein